MRVTIGDKWLSPKVLDKWPASINPREMARAEGEIRGRMMENIMRAAIPLNRKKVDALAKELVEAADHETLSLFTAVAAHTGKLGGKPGGLVNAIFGSDLAYPGEQDGGVVQWKRLSERYSNWKANKGHKRNKRTRNKSRITYHTEIHDLTGTMKRYFERNGSYIVHNRFGGIKANINYDGISEYRLVTDDKRYKNRGLGRIDLVIFPRLAPNLLPMLSGRTWSKTGDGTHLERELLPERTADKLSGGKYGPVRPLVLPIVQFYILNRIPGAVQRRLKQQFRTLLRPRRTAP